MNRHHARPFAATRVQLVAASLSLLGGSAWADTSPYTLGASETYAHDSNFVHLADGASLPASLQAPTDWIATTTLFGSIDQTIGRQRFYANANVRDNRYRYNSLYDNRGYGLAAGLDWATVERVSGNLGLSSNRTLASFDRGNGNNAPDIAKNIEQTDQFSASVRVGVVTDVTLEAGYSQQRQRFSEVGARLTQSVTNLGVRERFGGTLTLGAGLRLTDGRYPDYNDSFHGRDIDLSANWVPNAVSSVVARLSLGRTEHSLATAQDFRGVTGALGWDWKPGGKLAFSSQFSRATGNDSNFETTSGGANVITASADNSRLTNSLWLNTSYEATAKIRLDASWSRASRTLTNSLSVNSAQPISATDGDQLDRLRFSARYAPTRTLELSCNLGRERRSADNSTLTYAYRSTTVACSAQFAVQP